MPTTPEEIESLDPKIRSILDLELSRRTALLGAGAGTALAAVSLAAPAPAFAAGSSLATIFAEAHSHIGEGLSGSPWQSWAGGFEGDWCAVFISWLLRTYNYGVIRTVFSGDSWRSHFSSLNRLGSTPTVGSLVMFDYGHIGIVKSIGTDTVDFYDGNGNAAFWTDSTVRLKTQGKGYMSSYVDCYAYPIYAGYDSKTGAGSIGATPTPQPIAKDEKPMFLIYKVVNGTNIFALVGPGYFAEFTGQTTANTLAARFGNAVPTAESGWNVFKNAALASIPVAA